MSKLNQQVQSVNIEFPEVRPILDLRFALTKKLDPRIKFTRGTPGTYVGPDGLIKTAAANEPRFDHDPITGECKGLLMEMFRTNLLKNSNAFDSWDYPDNITLIANSAISPDGTLNAYKQIENTSNGGHRNTQLIYSPSSPAGTYTFSIFVKQIGGINPRYLEYGFYTNNGDGADGTINWSDFFNTKTISQPINLGSSTIVSYGIISYPNDWYRVYVSATVGAFDAIYPFYGTSTQLQGNTYIGDGTSAFYVYGAQFEQGTYLTSYYPTDSTAGGKLRSGDIATIEGTNFSSWFGDGNPQELSVFFSGYNPDGVIGRNPNYGITYWIMSNLSISETIGSEYAGLPQFSLKKNGSNSYTNGLFTYANDLLNIKSMCLMNPKNIRIILNDTNTNYVYSSSPLVGIPTSIIRMGIGGAMHYDGAQINGTVERLAIYSKELSINQSQSFTL